MLVYLLHKKDWEEKVKKRTRLLKRYSKKSKKQSKQAGDEEEDGAGISVASGSAADNRDELSDNEKDDRRAEDYADDDSADFDGLMAAIKGSLWAKHCVLRVGIIRIVR